MKRMLKMKEKQKIISASKPCSCFPIAGTGSVPAHVMPFSIGIGRIRLSFLVGSHKICNFAPQLGKAQRPSLHYYNMEYRETNLKGVFIIEPRVFNDSRGYFMEAWKKAEFEQHIGKIEFIQDNESKSSYGVLRGLHYQKGEFSQAKLVRVIKGRVVDIAVDLRRSSPTFRQHLAVELSEDNKRQLFIPRGFAHGFVVLSPEAVFTYKVDNVYAPHADGGIRWDDPTLAIEWPIDPSDVITSEKDLRLPLLEDAELFE